MVHETATATPSSGSGIIHTPHLRRELGLSDLVFTQILFIVGLPWVGVAAKQGPAHVVFWLIAIALFYIPSAIVVIYLNRLMPLEGGLYQWAKLGFNDFAGFMVAWNLWLFAILNTSETGIQVTQYLAYVLGPARRASGRQRPLHGHRERDHLCRAVRAGDSRLEPGQVGSQGRRRADGRDVCHAAAAAVAEPRDGNPLGVSSADDSRARHLGHEPQPARQDGIWCPRRLRVRGHSRGRMSRSGSHDRTIGRHRRTDHRGDVHPGHELGARAGSDRSDRSDRADSAGAEHRVPATRLGGVGGAGHDSRPARRPRRAGERPLHRQHAASDGGGVGRAAARLVHPAPRAPPHAGQLGRLRRRRSLSSSAWPVSSASASRKGFSCSGMRRRSSTR